MVYKGSNRKTYRFSAEFRISDHRIGRIICDTLKALVVLVWIYHLTACGEDSRLKAREKLKYSSISPRIIQMNIPAEEEVGYGRGGIIVHDLDDDGLMDFIVSKPSILGAYNNHGRELWLHRENLQVTQKAESYGLPGWSAPGIQAADVDGDQSAEILFLTTDNQLIILDGKLGKMEATINLTSPPDTEKWEHLVIANFRGLGDRDVLLQTTNAVGYRKGRYLSAYSISDLMHSKRPQPLWSRNDFVAAAHNGARVADLNADGRDEVLGGSIISHDGRELFSLSLQGHVDAHMVNDIDPSMPGLEVVALEETDIELPFNDAKRGYYTLNRIYEKFFGRGNRIFLFGREGQLWHSHYKHREPQNAAVGQFDLERPGLEIWCRSTFETNLKPFVLSSRGDIIAKYELYDVAPEGWTIKGIELINTIDWTGGEKQLCVGKERHESGDVAIFDPLNGRFLQWFREKADRLYVADVFGDWREEVIVLNQNELHIYQNPDVNPRPDNPPLLLQQHYQRSKMTYNYYSP